MPGIRALLADLKGRARLSRDRLITTLRLVELVFFVNQTHAEVAEELDHDLELRVLVLCLLQSYELVFDVSILAVGLLELH